MALNKASELGKVLAEALGVRPNDCLGLQVKWEGGGFVTIDARIIARDVDEKLIIEDGKPVVALRTWTEGRFKRVHLQSGESILSDVTLYERIEKEG